MEREAQLAAIAQVLKDLFNGRVYTIALHNYRDLEALKKFALRMMGPLYISVDINREVYVIRRDHREEWKKNPDLWY